MVFILFCFVVYSVKSPAVRCE